MSSVGTQEIVIGVVVSRDCQDYSASLPNISLEQVLEAVKDHNVDEMVLKAFGKLYRGRTGCGGMAIYTDAQSIYNVVNNPDVPWANFGKVKYLWSASGNALSSDIAHITGFVIDPLSHSDTAIEELTIEDQLEDVVEDIRQATRPRWQDQYTAEELAPREEPPVVKESKSFFGGIAKGIKKLFGK